PASEEVERAGPGDVADLLRLSLRFESDDDPRGAAPRPAGDSEQRVRARLAAGATWVLRRDGRPVWKAEVTVEEPKDGALLAAIVTDAEWRRRGIALAGLTALCRRLLARGAGSVALHVADEN